MLKPDLKQAKTRTKNPVLIYNDVYKLLDEDKKIGLNKKYYLKTYGCQMNVRDSETIKAILEDMNFLETDNYLEADLLILNTCAVRENVHNKVFGMIGRFKHLKETRKDIIVGLMGCMAQEEVVVDKILNKYKWLNFVLGTHNLHQLPEVIRSQQKLNINAPSIEGDIYENLPVKRTNPFTAFVNIIYGCDKFCTYCIVPFTRGKERSRQKEDILKEINKLIKAGYQEVTLLGQNVNAYGKDLNDQYYLNNLLEDIAKTKIPRIRFLTSHPWDFTDEMIEVIKNNSNIMPYFHLPVQSGSSRILKLMGRRYTKEEYLTLFNKIKKAIPNSSITTDIIVGFPNETEEDFQETIDLVKECQFDGAYTFLYSPREGTPAAKLKDNVLLEVKEKRLHRLNLIVNEHAKKSNDKMLGKIVPVLIENYSDKNKGQFIGYTDTYKSVNVIGDEKQLGKIVDVEITDVKSWSLTGKTV
ncbi:MAG: tRNA (N6-isopentenyl adenosine(37)-C2)-methylthiotransferase MiaB [Mollicutes bacterium]|nr:tRNA (N6-isopentenyl adenosine(37)-C2)-methylthiotransferase MiaB [Mollicutes bacterium]